MSYATLLKAAIKLSKKAPLEMKDLDNLRRIHINPGEKPPKNLGSGALKEEIARGRAAKKARNAEKLLEKNRKPVVKKFIGGVVKEGVKRLSKKLLKKPAETKFPTQKKGVIANKFKVTEGSRLDPDTGGSVNIGRKVGTKGEKVTGVNEPGAQGNNFLKEQQTVATRKRAALTVELEKKKKEGTLTAKEKVQLANINTSDREAFKRQTGQTTQAKQRRNDANKRKAKKFKLDDVAHLTQTGEIREGFKPTPNQIKTAIRNAEARKDTIDIRKLKAKLEMLEPTTPGNTAIKGYSGNTGKPKANLNSGKNTKPREFKNRAEERKAGGMVKKMGGGKIYKRGHGGKVIKASRSGQDLVNSCYD